MERLWCGQRFVLSAGQCRSKWLGLWAPSPGLPLAACDPASSAACPVWSPSVKGEMKWPKGSAQALDTGKHRVSVGSFCYREPGVCPRVSAQSCTWGCCPRFTDEETGAQKTDWLVPNPVWGWQSRGRTPSHTRKVSWMVCWLRGWLPQTIL